MKSVKHHIERWLARYPSAKTREAYAVALRKLWLHWDAGTDEASIVSASQADVEKSLARWREQSRPAAQTYNLSAAATCRFFAHLQEDGHRSAKRQIRLKRLHVSDVSSRRVPSESEVREAWKLLDGVDCNSLDERMERRVKHDRAMFALLVAGGLRRSELRALNVGDIEFRDDIIVVSVRQAKGYKSRLVGLPRTSKLEHILRGVCDGRDGDEPLLLSNDGLRRITYRQIGSRLATIWEMSGSPLSYSPHDMRAYYATKAFKSKVPVTYISSQMGHSDIRTTARYDVEKNTVRAIGSLE